MAILIKTNSRIKLISYNEDVFVFSIDAINTAKFYTKTKKSHSFLLEFVHQGMNLEELENHDSKDPDPSFSRLLLFINELKKNGLIEYHFYFTKCTSVILQPKSNQFNDSTLLKSINFNFKFPFYIISRFAYLRRDKNAIALECPLIPFKMFFANSSLMYVLPYLTGIKNLTSKVMLRKKTLQSFLSLLIEYNVIHPEDEKEIEYLNFWEFHDLLFHSRSRLGDFDDGISFGSTYRFKKNLNSQLIFKENNSEHSVALYKPDLNEFKFHSDSLSEILEKRRSLRNFNESKAFNLNELGEFLYRSIAIREVIKTPCQEAIFRPYPSAGAIHEIEFYLVVNNCSDLESDIYYYHSTKHHLFRKYAEKQFIDKINFNARSGMGISATPHIVFVLTSRFKKIAWKYEKMAYRSTLISMGGIFQTMSLVATSMNLASCIVGSGDSAMLAKAIKINEFEEGAIGEFALGLI